MSKLPGRYQCEIETPIGRQSFVLVVTEAEGGAFRGHAEGSIGGEGGTMPIEGTVAADELAWSMAVPKPMPITLSCRATIDGGRLEGKVKAGIFGSYPITGSRAG